MGRTIDTTGNTTGAGRHFLFLQGPHGPFFDQLGRMLHATGAQVSRVGFNAGDQVFWRDKSSYIPYQDPIQDWPNRLAELVSNRGITDIILYGDTRPVHAVAAAAAHKMGLVLHVFEEGYLRPYWISYERGGSNGNSRLMDMDLDEIQRRLSSARHDMPTPPDHWGDMREHMFYGALYHWFVLFRNQRYRFFTPHRSIPVRREFMLYLKRLTLLPVHWAMRVRATRRIKRGGFPYHLALLQLEHDASFQAHSPFQNNREFLQLVIEGFAKGAPSHHHLVFKAHPLEDGRAPQRRHIRELADEFGLRDRVHFVRGGKLAYLLDGAQTAVTVNSTAAQQALWRGMALKSFGAAVYDKPEFVSDQPLTTFFASPKPPDTAAYRDFRQFLLETSQVSGGFYAQRARRQLLRNVVDMILRRADPYDALRGKTAAPTQQLRLIK